MLSSSAISIIQERINGLPLHEYAFVRPEDVVFSNEVRVLCEQNTCGMYAKSWACPPEVGSIDDCKSQCLSYEYAVMFTTVSEVKNKFDVNGWLQARKAHEKITDDVAGIFRFYDEDALILSTEGCIVCDDCTYPDAPCRFPERMYPATEGYGILVIQQAKSCNIKYNNGENTVTYFSMVFFNACNDAESRR